MKADEARPPLRRIAVIALVLLAACSSPSSTFAASTPSATASTSAAGQAATAYAASFCMAFAGYEKQVLIPPSGNGSNPQALKRYFLAFFDDAVSATQDLVTKIKALGTPAVAGGAQVSTALIKAFTTAESEFRSIRAEVASLPTSNLPVFEVAFNRLSRKVDQDLRGTASAVNTFHSNPQLRVAFNSAPECAQNATTGPSSMSPALSSAASVPSGSNG